MQSVQSLNGTTPDIVIMWDLDETLVIMASLLNNAYATAVPGTDPETCRRLGAELANVVIDMCDRHLSFQLVEHLDVVNILDVLPAGLVIDATPRHVEHVEDTAQRLDCATYGSEVQPRPSEDSEAHIAKRLKATPQDPSTSPMVAGEVVDAAPTSYQQAFAHIMRTYLAGLPLGPEEAAQHRVLIQQAEDLTGGWLASAAALLQDTHNAAADADMAGRRGGLTVRHCLVTAGQLVATFGKLLLFGLDTFFDIRDIFSASGVTKRSCFLRIAERYCNSTAAAGRAHEGGNTDASAPTGASANCSSSSSSSSQSTATFVVVGDGLEEQRAAEALSWPFVRIRLAAHSDAPSAAPHGTSCTEQRGGNDPLTATSHAMHHPHTAVAVAPHAVPLCEGPAAIATASCPHPRTLSPPARSVVAVPHFDVISASDSADAGIRAPPASVASQTAHESGPSCAPLADAVSVRPGAEGDAADASPLVSGGGLGAAPGFSSQAALEVSTIPRQQFSVLEAGRIHDLSAATLLQIAALSVRPAQH